MPGFFVIKYNISIDYWLIVGVVGMSLILLAFLMEQSGKWKNNYLIYDLTNFLGSLLMVFYAISGKVWPFMILNLVWTIYSLKDVIIDLKSKNGIKK